MMERFSRPEDMELKHHPRTRCGNTDCISKNHWYLYVRRVKSIEQRDGGKTGIQVLSLGKNYLFLRVRKKVKSDNLNTNTHRIQKLKLKQWNLRIHHSVGLCQKLERIMNGPVNRSAYHITPIVAQNIWR